MADLSTKQRHIPHEKISLLIGTFFPLANSRSSVPDGCATTYEEVQTSNPHSVQESNRGLKYSAIKRKRYSMRAVRKDKFLKLFSSCAAIILLVFMAACSSEDITTEHHIISDIKTTQWQLSEKDALEKGAQFMGNLPQTTRSFSNSEYKVDYILRSNSNTRSNNNLLSDTIAYIINYYDIPGFVVVAGDERVEQILAYSDANNFSQEPEIVKDQFLNLIEDYLYNELNNGNVNDTPSENYVLPACVLTEPSLKVSLHQTTPYNKYVVKEHPYCPTGCVAVAAAYLISHAKTSLTYHDEYYFFPQILAAIKKGPYPNRNINVKKIVGGDVPEQDPAYVDATDKMAKLMYWIGKDIGIQYAQWGSGGDPHSAMQLIFCLGVDILCDSYGEHYYDKYPLFFNLNDIAISIKNNYLIFMEGENVIENTPGHAWVADAVQYCINPSTDELENIFLHFDWGWGGNSNGYYKGSIYNTPSGSFKGFRYFGAYCPKGITGGYN